MVMVSTRKIQEKMWAMGMPSSDARYANVVRAGMKAGLDFDQAFALAKAAYNASKGYSWKLIEGPHSGSLYDATRARNAMEHPNGKDAEDLLAEREGRPSRWGTPEFHRS